MPSKKKVDGPVTLKTLVAYTGLSLGTVSRALKNGPEVKLVTREIVQKAAAELGYNLNLGGLKLRTGKTFTLYIVLPVEPDAQDFTDSGYMALVSGIHRSLQGTHYTLVVHPQLTNEDALQGLKQLVENKVADGIIITQTKANDERILYLQERDFPFVSYGRSEVKTPHAWYDTDHEDMAYRATKRLIEKGHTRIAALNPSADLLYSQHRDQGYRRALKEAKIKIDKALISFSGLSAGDGKRIVHEMAALAERPTAFVCANEYASLGALSAFNELGWQAGRDVSLIATDDSNISAYFIPPLTTYYSSLVDAGSKLGILLLKRLEHEPIKNLQVLTQAELIERQDDLLHASTKKSKTK
jgi:LacI family transcriptional regulator